MANLTGRPNLLPLSDQRSACAEDALCMRNIHIAQRRAIAPGDACSRTGGRFPCG